MNGLKVVTSLLVEDCGSLNYWPQILTPCGTAIHYYTPPLLHDPKVCVISFLPLDCSLSSRIRFE